MSAEPLSRVRREPPAFGELAVARTERRTPHLVRVTLSGRPLHRFVAPLPAGSVRVLIPDAPGVGLVLPVWDGNAFRHRDGRRPVIRTLTPLRHDPALGELDVEVVLHGRGQLSEWAAAAQPGDPAALSGPGRGYSVAPDAVTFVLAGDESAIPAIGLLVDALPRSARATVIVEVAHPEARLTLTERTDIDVRWVDLPDTSVPGAALEAALHAAEITSDARVWVAGEAAGVHRIRHHLFEDRGVSRSRATVRGDWKHGRSGGDDDG